jgi:hypothetical protein
VLILVWICSCGQSLMDELKVVPVESLRTEHPVDIGLERPLQPNRVPTIAHYCSSDR